MNSDEANRVAYRCMLYESERLRVQVRQCIAGLRMRPVGHVERLECRLRELKKSYTDVIALRRYWQIVQTDKPCRFKEFKDGR